MASLSNSFRQNISLMSPLAKLLFLALLILGFTLFGSLLAMVIAIPVYNLSLNVISVILRNPTADTVGVMKYFQIFQSITLFILPSLLAAWFFSTPGSDYIRIKKSPSVVSIALVFMAIIAAVPFLNKITELNMQMDLPERYDRLENFMKSMEESAGKLTELFLVTHSTTDLLINFLMIAILPALGEEFLFRGVIQRLFSEWTRNAHIAIFITAFIFSFIHFQFYGFIPRFLLGMFFGYLLVWSGTIWVPVTAHLINNGMAVLYYHFSSEPVGKTALDSIGTGNGNYVLYLSVFLTSLLIGMIYLNERNNKEHIIIKQ